METLGFILMFGALCNFILLCVYASTRYDPEKSQYMALVVVGTLCLLFIDLIMFAHGLSLAFP